MYSNISPSLLFHPLCWFKGEILEVDERVGRKYIQQIEDLRAQLEKEKEIAVRKERENARQR